LLRFIHISIVALFAIVLASCTGARWTVKERAAIDESDYKVVEQQYFLQRGDSISAENPTLRLNLFSESTYEYTQRVLMQRNIQQYRLRTSSVALGISGAALAFYLGNANNVRGAGSTTKSWTLNAAGGLFLLSGFLNMKPVGEPRPTGEEKYLRGTGTTTKIDTARNAPDDGAVASLEVRYNGNLIFSEEDRPFSNTLEIPLADKLEELQLSGPNPGTVDVDVTFADSSYQYSYPVAQILQSYARVTSQLTELRNQPEEQEENILADLVKGSRLRINSAENERWYQVLYGISENYIRKEDAELIWREAGFAQESDVVTVPRVPFGNIDVESNIPILRGPAANRMALVVTNQNYRGERQERNYAHRDGQLMKAYLTTTLGYFRDNIFEIQDLSDPDKLFDRISQMKAAANDSTELFVYLRGYGTIAPSQQELRLLAVSTDSAATDTVSLRKLYSQIATTTIGKTVVLADIDFSASAADHQIEPNEGQRLIERMNQPLQQDDRAALLMGTQLQHPSSLYVSSQGDDKKHHIFPYFVAKALQQRQTSVASIYQYLERNISYTARRLFDRPQDPLLIGNSSIDLIFP